MGLFSMREVKKLLHPHYMLNIILAVSFLLLRIVRPICTYAFESCDMDHRETEIIFFTAVIIIFRTRKRGSVNLIPYLSTACMFLKLGNLVLFFYSDPIYGVVFLAACLVHQLTLPEPAYSGPENIVYIRGSDLEEELANDKKVVWMVEMYTAWNPTCVDFASQFAEISAKYSLDNLKFGKIDLTRNPETAEKYKINTSALSKQLPTLILFRNGKEDMRRPLVASNGALIPFSFVFENVVSTFDLNNLYTECKGRLKPAKSIKTAADDVTSTNDKKVK